MTATREGHRRFKRRFAFMLLAYYVVAAAIIATALFGCSYPTAPLPTKKIVAAKTVNELIATDGSTCVVSETDFVSAVEGEPFWCVWR